MLITAPQLRAARSLLDWSREELAKAAKVSPETIKNIEHGIFRPQEETTGKIIRAFAERGVEFTDCEGVRLRKDSVVRYEGSDGFKRFIDDVYAVAQLPCSSSKGDKPICISGVDDRLFTKYLGDDFTVQIRRMNALKDVKMRILIQEKPYTLLPEESKITGYREYKHHPDQFMGNVPFYVYGDKLAVLMFEGENAPQIVVIMSELVSKAYREQFNILWKTAVPLVNSSTKIRK